MDLTFQVPMQYCSLQHQTLLLSPVTSTAGYCFCFGSIPSFFLELFISLLISSSILGTYRPGEFLFEYPIILPFHTVHGVLKARILKWFAIPFSSEDSLLLRIYLYWQFMFSKICSKIYVWKFMIPKKKIAIY